MSVKQAIKEWVPAPALQKAKTAVQRTKLRSSGALKAFRSARTEPAWLPLESLVALEKEYRIGDGNYDFVAESFTAEAFAERARQRYKLIKRILGREYERCTDILETGAADAMIARLLQFDGKNVLATDIQDDELDERAIKDKVPFELWSATALPCEDDSYDLLYSFDSVEHMDDPEKALAEAIRVVRPGGYIYLRFGPLYWAPQGMHLGSRLTVPYASVLFEKETIDSFMTQQGKDAINHDHCNGWVLEQYRQLFKSFQNDLDCKAYYEHWDLSGLDLIKRFPSCFRRKSNDIESFLASNIEVLFQPR